MANNKFIKALHTINRKERASVFIAQMMVGACNLVLFIALVAALIIFRNNLGGYQALIIYSLHGLYIMLNLGFSLHFYFYLHAMLNNKERQYFITCLPWGILGINFFTSLNFYFKSGLSKAQRHKATAMIERNHVQEIFNLPATQAQLSQADRARITTLFAIAKNQHESLDNVNGYVLELLKSKHVATKIKVKDSDIVKLGYFL